MNNAVIFQLNDKAGFYSVFFFLCQAYIYAKQSNYDFYITQTDWYYAHTKGWHDYFATLTLWNPDYAGKYKQIITMSHMNVTDEDYTLNDYIQVIKEIYILNPELEFRAKEILAKVNNLISVFVRRGDKITFGEAPFMEIRTILEHTEILPTATIFIQSDDYRVVKEFKEQLPNAAIISTIPPDKFGSHARIWRRLSAEERKVQTEEMLIGLYICINSTLCWTDYTSNVGRFLKLANFSNIKFYSIDNKIPILNLDRICQNPAFGF
jgi:hypothetical protein